LTETRHIQSLLGLDDAQFRNALAFRRNIASILRVENKPNKKLAEAGRFPLVSTGFLLGLLIYFEDGGDMFLRNIGLPPNYASLKR
jgi:hypothetical protein